VLAAIGKEFEGIGGKYLEDVAEGAPGEDGAMFFLPGYSSWAFNPEQEDQLWRDSCKFVGVDVN
jgi:hypothetical protein